MDHHLQWLYYIYVVFIYTHMYIYILHICKYAYILMICLHMLFLGYLKSMREDLVIDYKKEFDAWKKEKYLNLDGAIQILHYLL